MRLRGRADAAALAPEEARELEDLVDAAELGATETSEAPYPDALQYEVTVRRGDEAVRACFSDAELTPARERLVERLLAEPELE